MPSSRSSSRSRGNPRRSRSPSPQRRLWALVRWLTGQHAGQLTYNLNVKWIMSFDPENFDSKESFTVEWRSLPMPKNGWPLIDCHVLEVSGKCFDFSICLLHMYSSLCSIAVSHWCSQILKTCNAMRCRSFGIFALKLWAGPNFVYFSEDLDFLRMKMESLRTDHGSDQDTPRISRVDTPRSSAEPQCKL